MTEIERLLEEGVITPDFLKPEVICDFQVTEDRKKLWAVLIDLLMQFDKVCRKNNLKYWVSFGGLLGIVRHNGFIPWDDDLDVCMFRQDYEKLLTLRTEFNPPYYLQIPCIDDGYFYSFSRLRNSNTSGISKAFMFQNFNQGCFLDIFPVDNCLGIDGKSNFKKIKYLNIVNSTNMKRSNPFLSKSDLARLIEYPQTDPIKTYREIEMIAQMHNNEETDTCSTTVMTIYPFEKIFWGKDLFNHLIEVLFYGHKIFIPKDYDTVLKTTYNNYMEFPPKEQRGTWHNDALFDAETRYSVLTKKLRNKILMNMNKE